MELIYIGDHFYNESKSIMSPIYDVEGRRQDWGFVQVALRNGKSVHIRQATDAERAHYQRRLAELKAEHAARPADAS